MEVWLGGWVYIFIYKYIRISVMSDRYGGRVVLWFGSELVVIGSDVNPNLDM